jgi:hypothetical protein
MTSRAAAPGGAANWVAKKNILNEKFDLLNSTHFKFLSQYKKIQ